MAGSERLCHIFEGGREFLSYFRVGLGDEKGWEPLLWSIRTHNAFFVVIPIPTLHRTVTLRVSDFTLKGIGVFCCVSEYNRKKQSTQSTTGELLADKVVRAF